MFSQNTFNFYVACSVQCKRCENWSGDHYIMWKVLKFDMLYGCSIFAAVSFNQVWKYIPVK